MQSRNSILITTNPLKVMSNKMIHIQIPPHTPLHQFRHIRPTLEPTESRSFPNPPRHHLKGSCADLVPTRRYPNDAGSAPPAVAAFERRSHDGSDSGAIEGIVDSPGCYAPGNVLLDVFAFGDVGEGIDGQCCSEFRRHGEFIGVDIDGDYLGCSGHFGSLDHRQTLARYVNVIKTVNRNNKAQQQGK